MPFPGSKPGANRLPISNRGRCILRPVKMPTPVAEDTGGDDVFVAIPPAIATRFHMLRRGSEQGRLRV